MHIHNIERKIIVDGGWNGLEFCGSHSIENWNKLQAPIFYIKIGSNVFVCVCAAQTFSFLFFIFSFPFSWVSFCSSVWRALSVCRSWIFATFKSSRIASYIDAVKFLYSFAVCSESSDFFLFRHQIEIGQPISPNILIHSHWIEILLITFAPRDVSSIIFWYFPDDICPERIYLFYFSNRNSAI